MRPAPPRIATDCGPLRAVLLQGFSNTHMVACAMLPQELIDDIIDNLANHREALKACSLTCQRWLHRSRCHLHRILTIYHKNCRIHPAAQVQRFRALKSLPIILNYARTLCLRGERADHCWHSEPEDAQDSVNDSDLFWQSLDRLSRIQVLHVTELYCNGHSSEERQRIAFAFPLVLYVTLDNCEFEDPGDLNFFLSAFPFMRSLNMNWIFWSHNHMDASATVSIPSRKLPPLSLTKALSCTPFSSLNHLQVRYVSERMDRRIVESLVASDSGSLRVKTLSLGPDELDIEMLPLWIRVVGTTLEHLQLYFGFINQPGIVHSAADCLKNCKSLHTVTLSAGIWNNSVFSVSRPNFWNSTLDVLQVPLQEGFLRTIYIICQSICIRTARSAALKAIDELLTRVSDRRALSVNFSFFNADARPEEMANVLFAAFPQASSRGIIKIYSLD